MDTYGCRGRGAGPRVSSWEYARLGTCRAGGEVLEARGLARTVHVGSPLSANGKGVCSLGDGAATENAFPPTTTSSEEREKGGWQRLRVVGLQYSRRADRLRRAASCTNVQAEDASKQLRNVGLITVEAAD